MVEGPTQSEISSDLVSRESDLVPSASEIARQVATGERSAVDILEERLAHIEAVDRKLNALVVRRFEAARAEARAIDERRGRGAALGPLAGVPITVKECFYLAGTQTTIGIPHLAGSNATADGPLVTRLKAAGAVIVGKTNVPQLMVMYETDNPLYGRTCNPWDAERSPGGSSGGEAAIIAAGGAPLGLGNDLGGSIRQPAHACGIHGFKPNSGRLTNSGALGSLYGASAIQLQPGPLARHVEDLALAMRVLVGRVAARAASAASAAQPTSRESDAVPLAWPDPAGVQLSGLRIGYWTDDGYFSPASPALGRVVEDAARALRARGAAVERIEPPDVDEAMRLYFALAASDGGAAMRSLLGRGPVDPQVRRMLRLERLPRWARRIAAAWFERAGNPRLANIIRASGAISAAACWRLVNRRNEFNLRFLNRLIDGGFTAFLTPPHALPAMPHGTSLELMPAGSYALLPNLLDFPAGVVAASRVTAEETNVAAAGAALADACDRTARNSLRTAAGLPIGVQVVGVPWREDIVLAIMAALETHFRQQPDYPRQPPGLPRP
jgi:fatty acid amide hydrolase